MKIAILGTGKFGRAIASLSIANSHSTKLWTRNKSNIDDSEVKSLITTDLKAAVTDADIVYIAVSSYGFDEVCSALAKVANDNSIFISLAKGLDKSTGLRMSQILLNYFDESRIGILSGPNLATEIVRGQIAGTVVASNNIDICTTVQNQLMSDSFRVYSSDDIIGVEWGGSLKNIYAIIFGMCDKQKLGSNTKGILISRCFAEIMRFGEAMGANVKTFNGLSGLGDLYTTCSSNLSRNYRFGEQIASGLSMQQALKTIEDTVEGVKTTEIVYNICNQKNISMPLVDSLYRILFLGESKDQHLKMLMQRSPKREL